MAPVDVNNSVNAQSLAGTAWLWVNLPSMSQDATRSESQDIPHDPDYFYPDGDCIVRVEDTLFRVCSARLVRWPKELTATRYTKRS